MNESEGFDLDGDLEERLREELRRVDAPEGFADRVMGRVAQQRSGGNVAMLLRLGPTGTRSTSHPCDKTAWMGHPGRVAAAAVLLVGTVLGGWQWRQQELRREEQQAQATQRQARVARQKFEMAMQVTGRTLVEVQERIGHAGEVRTAGRKREVE